MSEQHFPPTSRYAPVPTAELAGPDGERIVYLRRRFVPDPAHFVTVLEHTVQQGERIDQLAAAFLGDPELFWRMADANGVLHPLAMEEQARRLRLTLPEGMAGPAYA